MKTNENITLNEFLGLIREEITRVSPAESPIFVVEWR